MAFFRTLLFCFNFTAKIATFLFLAFVHVEDVQQTSVCNISATSVTFWIERALWAGWAWPGCCHGACYCNVRPSLAHFLIVVNEYLPLVCWGCSIFLFYFLCLLCIFLIILHHCLVCTRWYTETFPWSRGLCPPWKLVCKFPLEAQWARWKWALVSLSTGHEELRLAPLPLEWASGSWGVV